MKPLRVLTLTRYGPLGASSRLRFLQYVPSLEQAGFVVHVQAFLDDAALQDRYERGQYRVAALLRTYVERFKALQARKQFDLIWIEKEALPWLPLWLEAYLLRGVPFVLDFDDAVFHNYDMHRFAWVRWLLGKRLDGLMAKAALVAVGNEYLAKRARHAGAAKVVVLPTVIDINRYPVPAIDANDQPAKPLCIVWIGSPSTVKYLRLLEKPLQTAAQQVPFVLRVIGTNIELPGVDVQCMQWSEATEVEAIASGDVGVMPLLDSPWEQGKCGYKLIQYMACGLPVVASPVGVNCQIVEAGVNGFLAASTEEWVQALLQLLQSAQQRRDMGLAGRAKVEESYCIQKTSPLLADLLLQAARGQ